MKIKHYYSKIAQIFYKGLDLIDNLSQQQRMILAVVLSIIFFVVYDTYFMPKPKLKHEINTTVSNNAVNHTVQKDAPKVNTQNIQTNNINNAPKSSSKILVKVDAKDYKVLIDEFGRITKYTLIGKKFKTKDGGYTNVIDESMKLKPLEIRFEDSSINSEAFSKPYTSDKATVEVDKSAKVVLTQKLSSLKVIKEITFKEDGTYQVVVKLSKPQNFYITNGEHPIAERDQFVFNGVIVEKSDDTLEMISEGDANEVISIQKAKYLASSDKYYTTVFYDFKNGLNVVVAPENENPAPFIVSKGDLTLNGYIGPKSYDKLKNIDPELINVIEYGFFTFIAKPMFLFLKYIYSLIGNWGWTIVVATILIKLFLFPLTFKGMVSMNKMKELAPKLKEIREKYKSEPQKMNAKMMELYKKHGANPMGGCLPMLLQIPIFFAIYRVLLNAFDLKDASWILWYSDLSKMDPYYVLPLLMGATMFWQQKITPTNFTDPMQEKIMKYLPLIFTFFFITFPAGLTLYWFTNNLSTIAQQYYVNAIFEKQKVQGA